MPTSEKPAHADPPPGFESVLWKAANKLRHSMDPSESMQVILGLIFLKYISDQSRHSG
ncbi:MAG: hypothetical protein D084_Lepto4C00381G0006 [Leptospirillum sp. Group IV 'UBA BS']|nr:MAG: hypothetical protein D084_Lepto4C00381G0006 [Leptospirillum sp. Group IV 'UBA BS']